jgi:hypothetical protein
MATKLEKFSDVQKSIADNPTRKFHLLLGNGFSMAFDPKIFSYNALHNFITKIKDHDLTTILNVIETKNFEVIMQHLDSFSALLKAFGGNVALQSQIDSASAKLKTSLVTAVQSLHPEHVFKVSDEQSVACHIIRPGTPNHPIGNNQDGYMSEVRKVRKLAIDEESKRVDVPGLR